MNKKNIWIINQYTGSPYHGMNYRSYYLAKEFIKNGHSVTIFAGSYSHLFTTLPKTKGVFTKENIDGINYIWVKTPKYKKSRSLGRIINMFIFMFILFFVNIFKMKKPDEIIISSLSLFPVINTFFWSKIFKIRFIFEVRDLWPLTLVELGNVSKNNFLVLILGFIEKFGYRKAKYVVSVLPNAKKYMIGRGMTSNKFRYIPNGIFLKEELSEEVSTIIKRQIPKDKFIVGYTGTIGISNALEYFIEAAVLLKKHDNICFVLVGNGGEKEKLLRQCQNNKLENVIFFDSIPKNEIQSMLNLFDVCYIGWYKYNLYRFGISANKIFDYMHSGRPIIHSTNASSDPIKEANSGWSINAEDSIELSKLILSLLKLDNNTLIEKGKNGQDYVLKYHNYVTLAKKYEGIFS